MKEEKQQPETLLPRGNVTNHVSRTPPTFRPHTDSRRYDSLVHRNRSSGLKIDPRHRLRHVDQFSFATLTSYHPPTHQR